MSTTPSAHRLEGVYYAPRDCGGFGRRLVCGVIDAVVLCAAWVALSVIWYSAWPHLGQSGEPLVAAWILTCFMYLVVLKRSRVRTLGYRVTGLKVVDLRGGRPSLLKMSLRSGMLIFGYGFVMIDLLFTLGKTDRRKLSDRIAGTYVVRSGAVPAGRGALGCVVYCVLCYFFILEEVMPSGRSPSAPVA